MKTKVSKIKQVITEAVFKGVINTGELQLRLNQNEKSFKLILNRAKRRGLISYEFIGNNILMRPTKKAYSIAMNI